MPSTVEAIQVMIASPGDVEKERKLTDKVIHQWNTHNAQALGVMFNGVMWERNVVPELGDRPQSIINRQATDRCDLMIAIFGNRFGTPTGVADSGTEEEIERFSKMGRHVLLYRSTRPVSIQSVNIEQVQLVNRFFEGIKSRGIYSEFKSLRQFEALLNNHLTIKAREISSHIKEQEALIAKQPHNASTSETEIIKKRMINHLLAETKTNIGLVENLHQKIYDGQSDRITRFHNLPLPQWSMNVWSSYIRELPDLFSMRDVEDFHIIYATLSNLAVLHFETAAVEGEFAKVNRELGSRLNAGEESSWVAGLQIHQRNVQTKSGKLQIELANRIAAVRTAWNRLKRLCDN